MNKASKSLKIFISYGHEIGAVDDSGNPYSNPNNESVVHQIKTYLESRGHEIWLDKDKIKPGDDWRKAIYNGVEWSDVALICLSHKAMKPNGVCRDEISIAMGVRGGNMFSVKLEALEDAEYPAYLLNRQLFSKFQDWRIHCIEDNIDEAWLDKNLETLAQSLEEENVWRYGVEMVELKKLLKPWNMNSRLRSLDRGSQYLYNDETDEYEKKIVHKFCGRESLFELFENEKSQEAYLESDRILWLKKGPGFGKSRFAAELLYRYYFAISAAYFVEYNLEESHKSQTFIKSVAYQLAQTNSSYRERLLGVLRANLDEINRQIDNPEKLFKTLVVDLLEDEFDEERTTQWILVDALDEATENSRNEIASLISQNIDNLPSWIRFYITSRDNDNAVNQSFNDFTPIDFEDEENVNDILEYIRSEFSALGLSVSEELINILLEKSEGTFLYPEMVFRDLEKNAFTVDDIRDLPKGVIGYIHAQFERLFLDKLESYNTEIRPWLGYVLTSCEPIPRGVLKYALGIQDDSELESRLNLLGTFFVQSGYTDEDTVAPFHKSVNDYCFNKNVSFIFYVDPDEAKERFAQTGLGLYESGALQWIKRTDEKPDIAQRYFLTWLPSHLMNANDSPKSAAVLSDFAFLMKRLRFGNVERVLLDYILFRGNLDRISKDCSAYFDVICSNAHYLRHNSEDNPAYKIMLQIATEVADDCPVTLAAERWLNPEEGDSPCDWFWINKVNRPKEYQPSPYKLVIEYAGDHAILLSNGNALSWGTDDYNLRIWDLETGACKVVMKGHTDEVYRVLELRTGDFLSWSKDRTLRIWSPDGTCKAVSDGNTDSDRGFLELRSGAILSWCIYALVEKKSYVGQEEKSIRIWAPDGNLISVIRGHSKHIKGAIELQSGEILSYSDDSQRIWSTNAPNSEVRTVLEGRSQWIEGARELRSGDILTWDNESLHLWSSDGERKADLEGHTNNVREAIELDSGDILSWCYGDDNTLRLWSPDGVCKAVLEGHNNLIYGAIELRSGDLLSWDRDGVMHLWSPDGVSKAVLEGHTDYIIGAKELSSGDILSWSKDSTIRLWSPDGACKAVLKERTDYVKGVIELPSGDILSWSNDQSLCIRSIKSIHITIEEGHIAPIDDVLKLSSDNVLSWCGDRLNGSKDHTLRLWSPNGKCIAVMGKHKLGINGAIELKSGNILSWSDDKTLRIWSPKGKCIAVLKGHHERIGNAIELSSGEIVSSCRFLVCHDNTLRLWSPDGTCKAVMEGHTDIVWGTKELRSGDIISWSSDRTLRIWSADGKCKAVLKGHTDDLDNVMELRSGDILSWSRDATLRIWSPYGDCKAVMEGHESWIEGAKELRSGDILSWCLSGNDYTLRRWSPDGTCKAVMEGHTDEVKGAIELDSDDILSWSWDQTLRIWSPDGSCKEIIEQDDPRYDRLYAMFWEDRVYEQFYSKRSACGIELQHDYKPIAQWNGVECTPLFVGAGRLCVWYGSNVEFLQLNYGNHTSVSFSQTCQLISHEIEESNLTEYTPISPVMEDDDVSEENDDAFEEINDALIDESYSTQVNFFEIIGKNIDTLGNHLHEYYQKAENGDLNSQITLGRIFYNGFGVPVDKSEAIKWWLKAAEQGNIESQAAVAMGYENGDGIEQNIPEAIKWYRKAAEQGHAISQLKLFYLLLFTDNTEAIKWLTSAAEQGNVDAQFGLALCYHTGKGCRPDMEKAIKWYFEAAKHGHPQAQYAIGSYYQDIKGDIEEAIKWYRKAAGNGNASAQYNLGQCYYQGDGVEQDSEEAVKWFLKAAEQDDDSAQYLLGVCYITGDGVPKNSTVALDWFHKAADQGDDSSMYAIGLCYYKGDGVEQDSEEAVKWFSKAAQKGNARAQFYLGVCYYNGEGVERDKAEAKKWLNEAAKQGNEDAIKALNSLKGK